MPVHTNDTRVIHPQALSPVGITPSIPHPRMPQTGHTPRVPTSPTRLEPPAPPRRAGSNLPATPANTARTSRLHPPTRLEPPGYTRRVGVSCPSQLAQSACLALRRTNLRACSSSSRAMHRPRSDGEAPSAGTPTTRPAGYPQNTPRETCSNHVKFRPGRDGIPAAGGKPTALRPARACGRRRRRAGRPGGCRRRGAATCRGAGEGRRRRPWRGTGRRGSRRGDLARR